VIRRRSVIVALSLLALAGGGARAGDSATEALQYARSRYESGSYSEACEAARAVLDDDPKNPEALAVLARGLSATGDEAGAEKELRATLARVPSATAAALLLGENLADRGSIDAAIPLFQSAQAGFRIRALSGLARAYAAAGRRDDAAREVRQLFAAYQAAHDEDLSAEDLRALARAALTAETIPSLAREHVRPFAIDARDFFQRSFERDKDQTDLLVEWARVYIDKWDLVEARRLLREALKRNARHPRAHALVAEALLMDLFGGTAKYDQARDAIEAALAVNPSFAEAHVLKAELLVTDSLYDEAIAALDLALSERPLDVRALAEKAGILRLRDDLDAAAALEKRALERGKPAGAEFCWRLAALLDAKFRYVDANAFAAKAIEIDPDCSPAYSQLGLSAMRVGDEATARKYLEKAHEADPFDLFTFNQLKLLDYLEREFETTRTERFILRVHKSEALAMRPYLLALLDRCWTELSARYGVKLDSPILIEVFPNLNDFSVRAVAHRFIPASGVTFARVVALASPGAFPPGAHGWGRVLWHELAHVATLERSNYRVPRWLTEGLSVFEESKGSPAWVREWDVDLVDALERGRLLPILELNQGFSKPKFPNQVMLSYYQGGLICQFIEQTWGFESLLKLLDGYREDLPLSKNLGRALAGVTPDEFDRRFIDFARKSFVDVKYRAPCADESTLSELRREAKEHARDPDALARYALAAADMKRYADAEAAAGQLKRIDPTSGDATLVDALVARHRKEFDRVPQLAAAARAGATRDPLLAELLQAEYFSARDPTTKKPRDVRKAIAALESAHGLFKRNPAYPEQLVALYEQAGEDGKRRAMLATVAELEPNNVGARLELAGLARQRADWATARRWLEELLWLDPRPGKVHAWLAEARAQLADPAGAKAEIEIGIALAPEDPDVVSVLATLKKSGALGAGGPATLAPPAPPPSRAPVPATGGAVPEGDF
jgi:Tfp pilus assembly protein PilF